HLRSVLRLPVLSLRYLFESAEDLVDICIELDGVAARGVDLCAERCDLIVAKQFAPMILDGVVGVLEGVAGEQQHYRFRCVDLPCCDEFLQPGERDGGSGFTADTCSTQPPVAWMTRTALRHDAGLPMRMALARVWASTGVIACPSLACMLR